MQRTMKQTGSALLMTLYLLTFAYAQKPASDKPESVGLSSERLQRVNQLIERKISEGKLVGAITLVARRGRLVHLAAAGQADAEVIRDAPAHDGGETPRDQPRLKNCGGLTMIRTNRRIRPRTECESGSAAAPRVQAQRSALSPERLLPGPSLRLDVRAPSLRDEVWRRAPLRPFAFPVPL
jgi:hypothetical protein